MVYERIVYVESLKIIYVFVGHLIHTGMGCWPLAA
jgi:hypothetical protein